MNSKQKIKILQRRIYASEKIIRKYEDALIWCSASEDFQLGGKARKGWEKLCLPFIKKIINHDK